MPHRFSRLATLVAGLALVAGGVSVPGSAIAARPSGPGRPTPSAEIWIVVLRTGEGTSLPARRGGLRPAATAIARERAATTSRTIDALEASVGFAASQRYTYALSGFAARLSPAQRTALRADRRVVSLRRARPVLLAGTQVTPAGILRVGASPDVAPAASGDVTVAVVDTGIGAWVNGAWRHGAELAVVGGVDAFDADGAPCADRVTTNRAAYDDTNGHGTHVAGTIGAADNGVGVVGVAPGARLVSVRVFQGVTGSDATVICGLDWIAAWNADHPSEVGDIDVVNMSLRGFAPTSPGPTGCVEGNPDPQELAVCAVIASGASVVVAAGNETDEVANYTPSRYESVITVSAMSDFDGIPGGLGTEPCVPPRGAETDDAFSRYSNFGPEVDLTAPGTCVRSTDVSSATGTLWMSGTSMATPHVTGAIARYLGMHPAASPSEVRANLLASASSDWDADTDPDGQPDRLVDVDALVAGAPGVAVGAVPLGVSVPSGTPERSVKVRLQRIGGYDGPASLSVVGGLPAGVTAVAFGNDGQIPAGLDTHQRSLTITFADDPPDGLRALTIRADGDGGVHGQTTLPLRFDSTPPSIAGAWPRIVFRSGSWVNSAPVRLSWNASDAQGALRAQELLRSRRGGPFSIYGRPGPSAGGASASMERRVDTAWRIRATDLVGNTATSSVLATRMVPAQAQMGAAGPGWSIVTSPSAAAKDLLVTSKERRVVTFPFTGRAVAVVAPVGPGRGRFKVRLDGRLVATIDAGRRVVSPRRLVWVSGALDPGPHTLRIVSAHGRVGLDAFLVLK